MTTRSQDNKQSNISKAASILGSKGSSPEERSKAARQLGAKGGAHSHGGGRSPKETK